MIFDDVVEVQVCRPWRIKGQWGTGRRRVSAAGAVVVTPAVTVTRLA